MKHRINVYYLSCPKMECSGGTYLAYQRKIADQILNYALKNMFHTDVTGVERKKRTGGKPYLKDMEEYHYNISNTDGMIVLALSDLEVGVDCEQIKARRFRSGVMKKCCTREETAYINAGESAKVQTSRFFQIWTLKESYIKMTGEGMRIPLTKAAFQLDAQGNVCCSQPGKFWQKRIGEYWISLGAEEDAIVKWCLLGLENVSKAE